MVSSGKISNYVTLFILGAILFTVVAELIPTINDGLGNISASGAPLADLFARNGIILLLAMAGLVVLSVKTFMGRK